MPTLTNGVFAPQPDGNFQISETGVAELYATAATADAAIGAARGLAADADATSRARDEALEALIEGMEGMTYVGAWASGTTYRINDVVTHGGDSWARLTAGSQGTPGSSPTHWGLVARKGDGGGFGELTETAVAGLWEGVETTVLPSQVQGLTDALAGKSDVAHTHTIAQVNGLQSALDTATGYDSGERDITSRISGVISGRVLVWRLGRTVHLTFDQLVVETPDTPHWLTISGLLTVGFRGANLNRFYQFAQQVVTRAAGPIRVDTGGSVVIYNAKAGNGQTLVIEGTVSFPTPATLPTTLPGVPA